MAKTSPKKADGTKPAGGAERPVTSPSHVPSYAVIAFIAFLCCGVLLFILIKNAEKLSRFGLLQPVYYLVLVPMALTAAVVLFGVLPSTATWAGAAMGGTLRLSGSIVGFALVMIGGIYIFPKPTFFALTVYVHGEGGPQDIVLRNSGQVLLQLGPEITPEQIGGNGQAVFPRIPAEFRGRQVPGWVESDDYEASNTSVTISGDNVDLTVKKKIKQFKLAGTVLDERGNPLPSVRVSLHKYHLNVATDSDGRYEFQVTSERQEMVELTAEKEGFQTKRLSPTLGDSEVNFALKGTVHAVH